MKLSNSSHLTRAGLAVMVACPIFALPRAHSSTSTTITADKDSVVDTLVDFPYRGLDPNIWVNYDSVGGPEMSRSYIRFPLSSISETAHILGATLQLNCNFVLQGGGTVEVYRSADDGWPENGINFGNQPGWGGVRLALGSITFAGAGPKSIPLSLANWTPLPDINDDYVTFVIKTLESSNVGSIRFDSLDSLPGGTAPTLKITVRSPGSILNPDMDDGTTGWNTDGNVSVADHPYDPGNPVVLLETASQSAIWQQIDTPNGPFSLEFDADFLTPTGTFTILINDQVIYSVTAPDGPRGGTSIFAPELQGLTDVDLKFTLDGPDGTTSQLILDQLSIIPIPTPRVMMTPGDTPGDVLFSFFAEPNGWYDIESSPNAEDWSPHGRRISGLDLLYEELIPVSGQKRFFRLRYIPHSEPSELEVPNQGFELPELGPNGNTSSVPDWSSSGGAGVWNPPVSVYPPEQFEDNNVAYVHNGHTLSQTLTHVLEPYRIYTLDALLGKRHDITWPTSSPPDLILRAGGVNLTPFESVSPAISVGTFDPWWRRYKIGKTHPHLGEPLEIVLHGGTSGITSQVNFDVVILEID